MEAEEKTKAKRERKRDGGMVIIKAGERSYADLLKKVKTDTGRDFEIKQVIKTRKGDLALYTEGDGADAKKIKT